MRPDPSLPFDLQDLSYGEHLIVWAFRAFAKNRDCVLVRREFVHGCGERAEDAHLAMRIFVRELALQARRDIVLAPPGCLTVTRDEQVILQLFAAAQAGEEHRFAAHFRWLAANAHNSALERVVGFIVGALADQGHRLRQFEVEQLPTDLPPQSATLRLLRPPIEEPGPAVTGLAANSAMA